jgi:hypothetical protein
MPILRLDLEAPIRGRQGGLLDPLANRGADRCGAAELSDETPYSFISFLMRSTARTMCRCSARFACSAFRVRSRTFAIIASYVGVMIAVYPCPQIYSILHLHQALHADRGAHVPSSPWIMLRYSARASFGGLGPRSPDCSLAAPSAERRHGESPACTAHMVGHD